MRNTFIQPDQPLGLPRGSVRSVLALGIVGATVVGVFVLGVEQSAPLLTLGGVVVERYFGSRGPGPVS